MRFGVSRVEGSGFGASRGAAAGERDVDMPHQHSKGCGGGVAYVATADFSCPADQELLCEFMLSALAYYAGLGPLNPKP